MNHSIELSCRLRRIINEDETARDILIDACRRLLKKLATEWPARTLAKQLEDACLQQANLYLRTSAGTDQGYEAMDLKEIERVFRRPVSESERNGLPPEFAARSMWGQLLDILEHHAHRHSRHLIEHKKAKTRIYFRWMAVLLMAALFIILYKKQAGDPDMVTRAWLTANTGKGERTDLLFQGDRRIWLNQQTRCRYPAEFERWPLEIYLSGEAYFEIPEGTPSITVYAGPFTFRSSSGSFNLETSDARKEIQLSVFSGSVEWKEKDQEAYVSRVDGSQAMVWTMTGEFWVANLMDVQSHIRAWKTGCFTFENAELSTVIKILEKSYMVQFRSDEDGWMPYSFTGSFQQAAIEDILSNISLKTPVKFIKKKDTYHIYESDHPKSADDFPEIHIR